MDKSNDRILIIDDNYSDIKILGNILKKRKYLISIAQSGKEALAILEEVSPDCILLDVSIPEMTGFEICAELKANDKFKNIPIIFVTGRAESENIIKGFQCGGQDYIVKPFIAEELLVRLENSIKLKKYNFHLKEMVEEKTEQLVREIQKQKDYERKLIESREELKIKNLTLQELFNHIENEKKRYKEELTSNLQTVIIPTLEKIEKNCDNRNDQNLIEYLKNYINGLLGSKINLMQKMLSKLTPRETEVCNLIKQGKLNKEISQMLNISEEAIKFHRKNIREKLEIKNKDVNLNYFLNNLLDTM